MIPAPWEYVRPRIVMSSPCAAVATVAAVGLPVSWSMLGLLVLVTSTALHEAINVRQAGNRPRNIGPRTARRGTRRLASLAPIVDSAGAPGAGTGPIPDDRARSVSMMARI